MGIIYRRFEAHPDKNDSLKSYHSIMILHTPKNTQNFKLL